MIRKILVLCLVIAVVFSFSGCNLMMHDTAELLSAPSLPKELKPIADIIAENAPAGYTLKYPSRGEYRSAIIRHDIDADGFDEAFVFYYTTDGETGSMHIDMITKRKGNWSLVARQEIVAGGVDKVAFSDLNSDGTKEILIGWEIYGTSEMQLAVYTLDKNGITQMLLERYTHFLACDLDENSKEEILVIKADSKEAGNSAFLYGWEQDAVTTLSSCALDSAAKTIAEPIIAPLSTGKTVAYIEEIKGIGAITEVLIYEKGVLKNPLYSADFKETVKTLRSVSLPTTDINGDGILEIPVQENVPSVAIGAATEILYLTNWCSFDGESLTIQQTSMININDGYMLNIPARLIGKIAILKNTQTHERGIYLYDSETLTVGDNLLTIQSVSQKDWESMKKKSTAALELVRADGNVHILFISEAAEIYNITHESVKAAITTF